MVVLKGVIVGLVSWEEAIRNVCDNWDSLLLLEPILLDTIIDLLFVHVVLCFVFIFHCRKSVSFSNVIIK